MFRPSHRLMQVFDDVPPSGGGGGGGAPTEGGEGGAPEGGQGGLQPPSSNPWDAVPKSWAQEVHSHWEKVSPEVRQYIHKRETDVEKGIRTYSEGHQRWQRLHGVLAPHADPDTDVTGLYETLAQNHVALVKAEPAQRRAMLAQLAKAYGVDFATAAEAHARGGEGAEDGRLTRAQVEELLEQRLTPLQRRIQEGDRAAQQEHARRVQAAVDAFFSDPKNEFVSEVAPQMLDLIQKEGIRDLQRAYELAILSVPEVKAKYLAKLAAEAGGGQGGGKPPGDPRNIKSDAGGAPPDKPGTIDETMAGVISKYYPGHKT